MEETSRWFPDLEDGFSRRVHERLNRMFDAHKPTEPPLLANKSTNTPSVEEDPAENVEPGEDGRNWKFLKWLETINEDDLTSIRQLKTKLNPIQQEGLKWMYWRETQKKPGGILADEMGLGKTLTTLSLILKKKEEAPLDLGKSSKKLTLIICPASLVTVWKDEANKHLRSNSLQICIYHGKNRPRKRDYIYNYDVIVTSYAILLKEKRKNGMLFTIDWERLVLDEAHHVRNSKSATYEAVFGIGARINWSLTGTPYHNSDKDMLALLQIVDRTVLKKTVKQTSILSEYMLRRSTQFAIRNGLMDEIPTMDIHRIYVKLRGRHKKLYRTALMMTKPLFTTFSEKEKYKVGATDQFALDEACGIYKEGAVESPSVILAIVHKLLQISSHPGLLKKKKNTENNSKRRKKKQEPKINKFFQVLLADCSQDIQDVFANTEEVTEKMIKTLELVREILKKKEKVIIVSKFQKHLDIIEQYLMKNNIQESVKISGAVPGKDRKPLYEAFKRAGSPYILLTTLLCGNEGLTLTVAQHMIILENHWNPQQLNQCMKRIHRIGQKKKTQIYLFITNPSVEMTVQQVADDKEEDANYYLEFGNKESLERLSRRDLHRMCNLLIAEVIETESNPEE